MARGHGPVTLACPARTCRAGPARRMTTAVLAPALGAQETETVTAKLQKMKVITGKRRGVQPHWARACMAGQAHPPFLCWGGEEALAGVAGMALRCWVVLGIVPPPSDFLWLMLCF